MNVAKTTNPTNPTTKLSPVTKRLGHLRTLNRVSKTLEILAANK